jgi:aryl-alcohol dehydrogenase-like predicted oxidoreductase
VVDGRLDGIERYIEAIREAGMIPGTAVHNGERLALITRLGYDFDAYMAPVNQAGFAMHPDRPTVLAAIAGAGRPVIAIKPLACGRFDEGKPGEWLRWTLDQAGVVATAVGVMSEEEASEDLAAAREILTAPVGM